MIMMTMPKRSYRKYRKLLITHVFLTIYKNKHILQKGSMYVITSEKQFKAIFQINEEDFLNKFLTTYI